MTEEAATGVYGAPPAELADVPRDAIQFSPLVPGSAALERRAEGSLAAMVMLAPPGTIERRYDVAQALRALQPGGRLTVLAPKDKGGSRLAKELRGFGCEIEETAQRHHRICVSTRPADLALTGEAIADGAPQLVAETGLWSQPGVFSWNRVDPGSALLLKHLPQLSGRGADLGCGVGYLARAVLAMPGVEALAMVDIDRRAVEAAVKNIADPRASLHWADVRKAGSFPENLDFIVMNPPFHDGGAEDRSLGQAFVRRAAESLRKGGRLWLTANRHLPYEEPLKALFSRAVPVAEAEGFKIYEARK
ncbi:methyltransferase [Kaistia sp. 32K]|uniref:class I SAM-dependent methyltransferase n=1 Tax=Kaistia sp. 32K TaxID=2795690 RepID=UPI00191574C9|nr:class I SAM-dependent methyltransferase [Kaistia sp. 32K]BCP53605.1 methyltransferase [Kaistia sp. 32K]